MILSAVSFGATPRQNSFDLAAHYAFDRDSPAFGVTFVKNLRATDFEVARFRRVVKHFAPIGARNDIDKMSRRVVGVDQRISAEL